MNERVATAASIALVGVALGACEVQDEAAMDETAPPAEQPMVEEEPAPETTAPGEVSLEVAEEPELGSYLTDSEGRSLYLFTADSPGQSACHDECASAWPPLLASDTALAGEPEVEEGMIGTIERRGGGMQVTYNEHPLYYYTDDRQPGQTLGQDVQAGGGEWYLVTPEGEPLEGAEGDGAAADGTNDTGTGDDAGDGGS